MTSEAPTEAGIRLSCQKLIRNHAEIKLAFTKSINELLTRKDELTTAERDEAEVAKLT